MTYVLSLPRDFKFQLPCWQKAREVPFRKENRVFHARCWQQGGYALKKGGLDRQLATVVCRIIWTLSVCWKLDFFCRERTFTSFFAWATLTKTAVCQTDTKTPKLYVLPIKRSSTRNRESSVTHCIEKRTLGEANGFQPVTSRPCTRRPMDLRIL